MRNVKSLLIAGLVMAMASAAVAELQNVEVGGSIRIRGNYYSSSAATDAFQTIRNPAVQPWWFSSFGALNPANGLRSPGLPFFGLGLPFRPLGGRTGNVFGAFKWNDDGESLSWVEQRTRLYVKADFTNEVCAFIELDSYDVWGEDFRSNYITGNDFRAASGDDVEIYQAYIEASEMFGYPLRLRVGRQEMPLGSEWLFGTNDTAAFFPGLSFDAVRLTYATDMFSVDAFWAKLAENSPLEEDGDVDLYGVYGSYLGIEDVTIDAYYALLRDARGAGIPHLNGLYGNDTQLGIFGEWVEDLFGVDQYDPTYLHTVGLRGAGEIGAFDFEAEVAYQFGEADAVGRYFGPVFYGDSDADFDNIGGNLELGYTFDMAYTPRVFVGGAYFGGEDNRDISFWQWLVGQFNPFYTADASVSFNRLFSNWEYTEFFENTDLSNVWLVRGGVSVNPTENVEVLLTATYFESLEEFDDTWPDYTLWGNRLTWFSPLSWITEENDSSLGTEVGLYVTYNYSEDLTFSAGWAHLFVGDGLAEGQYSGNNGLGFLGGTDSDDADYVFVETEISF
ncbi:MAG: alginate export family protein [Candidatus Hydrogenedentes bacterium]|nr:alginate export family protein [Candidatus Hydrogenedentota bacterium]